MNKLNTKNKKFFINNSKNKKQVFKNLYEIWIILNPKRKNQLKLHGCIMVLSGLAEIVTLSAMFPFMLALSSPSKLNNLQITEKLFQLNLLNDGSSLLVFYVFIFVIAIFITASLRLFNLWMIYRLSVLIGSDLSSKAFQLILSQPYSFHIETNSSEIISAISTKVSVTVRVLQNFMQFITGIIIGLSLLIGLIIVEPFTAILASCLFILLYLLFSLKTKNILLLNSIKVADKRNIQFRSLQEGIGGIKDILMSGYQELFTNLYRNADYPMRLAESNSQFMASSPRFFIEAAGLIFISFLALILNQTNVTGEPDTLPLLATFALGAQRLLPAMQASYNGWASIRGNISEVKDVLKILKLTPIEFNTVGFNKFDFKKNIILKNIYFKYDKNSEYSLKNVNLTINRGDKIGIIGKSGSGKSTLLEILMGLLSPSRGEFLIDGKKINVRNTNAQLLWRRSIAYVPQAIFLSDNSIAENIAFGESYKSIDYQLLKKCSEIAEIYPFIKSLEKGFGTFVGERGVKLSGGQKQRIGIARALYKKKNIIAFDESTSALDSETEENLIRNIQQFNSKITILIIAHRISSLSFCNRIIKVENQSLLEKNIER